MVLREKEFDLECNSTERSNKCNSFERSSIERSSTELSSAEYLFKKTVSIIPFCILIFSLKSV